MKEHVEVQISLPFPLSFSLVQKISLSLIPNLVVDVLYLGYGDRSTSIMDKGTTRGKEKEPIIANILLSNIL